MKEYIEDNGEVIFGEKLKGIEYKSRAGVYGIAFNAEGKVAVVRTSGGYFLPGGGIEQGETHEECLRREFLEETGYEIEIESYVSKFSLYHKTRSDIYMYFQGYFYIVSLKQLTGFKIEEDHEFVWLDAEEGVREMHLKHQARALEEALKIKLV